MLILIYIGSLKLERIVMNDSRYNNRSRDRQRQRPVSSTLRRRKKKRRLRPWVKITLAVMAALILILILKKAFGGGKKKESSKEDKTMSATATPMQTTKSPENTPTVAPTAVPTGPKYCICIDPGHGFKDAGTVSDFLGSDTYEKDVTLAIAFLLKAELESRGHTVVMTHDGENKPKESEIMQKATELGIPFTDSYFKEDDVYHAYERTIQADILNKQYNFDMMISLHVNAFDDSHVSGNQVYYCSENEHSVKSEQIAKKIVEIVKRDFPEKKISIFGRKASNAFFVTKYTQMPSVLLEMGYATNQSDAKELLDDTWRQKYVKTIADAIEAGLA